MAKKKKKAAKKHSANGKKVRILSIDGGGIRGILPGQVLVGLEQKLKKLSGNGDARIADYFDLIAGTSTGGILACAYLRPDDNGRPHFTAEEAVEIYLDRGDEIFDISFKQKLLSLGGITDEKYSAVELEEALADYLDDTKLSELLKPCLITAYDMRRRKPHFFRQHRARTMGDRADFLVRDVARATSAAPTYFEVAKIRSLSRITYPLIDGGVFANNPAMCAYAEARMMDDCGDDRVDNPSAKDMIVVSIGTGSDQSHRTRYAYNEVKDWGKAQWIVPLIDILMSGNQDTVDFQLREIFNSDEVYSMKNPNDAKNQYFRIEPMLGTASSEMDNASPGNLNALELAGIEWTEDSDNDALLELIAGKLIAEA